MKNVVQGEDSKGIYDNIILYKNDFFIISNVFDLKRLIEDH